MNPGAIISESPAAGAPPSLSGVTGVRAQAQACRRAGFSLAQLDLTRPHTAQSLREALSACADEGIAVAALGCYGNPLQPQSRRSGGVSADDLAELLEALPDAAVNGGDAHATAWTIVTWGGTLSGNLFTPHPGNLNPGAVSEVARWAEGLMPALERRRARLLFKPHYAHALGSPNALLMFLSALNDPHFGAVLDFCNFLTPKNFHERDALLEQTLQKLGPFCGLAHLKDARIENFRIVLGCPGLGQMGYAGLLRQLALKMPGVPWLIEGAESELQLSRSRQYVELQARLAGL